MKNKYDEIATLTTEIARLQTLKAMHQEDLAKTHKNMTKEERIKAAWQMPALPEDLMDLIKSNGFQTGSSIYGDPMDVGDIDWAVQIHPRAFTGYAVGAEHTDYFETDGMQPLYCHYNHELINVICFSDPALLDAWYQATQMMTQMKNVAVIPHRFRDSDDFQVMKNSFDEKWARVRMFRALVDVLLPVKPLPSWRAIDYLEAKQYQKCIQCGREAIYFMNKASKTEYEDTLICERCR